MRLLAVTLSLTFAAYANGLCPGGCTHPISFRSYVDDVCLVRRRCAATRRPLALDRETRVAGVQHGLHPVPSHGP